MTHSPKIPFVDLVSLHQELEPELIEVFKRALRNAGFVGGPEVEGFEKEFAAFCGTRYGVGVSSGTDALRFALIASGVRPGEIVITVPHTFIATTEAITQAGARPDFVDIDPRTFTMDPEKLREYLETKCVMDQRTGRCVHKASGQPVTAVVPVHLYGQMADMDPITELAAKHQLAVVEDACQAHGAEYMSKRENKWLKAGSIGRAAAFSFYPGKNLGGCGEGGAVTTNDQKVAHHCTMLRDHGQSKKYYHDVEGYNGRLDAIQAGLLRLKLQHLGKWNAQRRESARVYDRLLTPLESVVTRPHESGLAKSVYHLYVVRTQYRDALQEHMTRAGVGTGIHYPIPIHLQRAYSRMGWESGDYPESERAANEILSLPMFAGLALNMQEMVIETIDEFAVSHAF